MPFHDFPREIEPRPTKVEDAAVGRGDDLVGLGQFQVRIVNEFDPPLPASLDGKLFNDRFQPAAVGNRPIQKPEHSATLNSASVCPISRRAGAVSSTLR